MNKAALLRKFGLLPLVVGIASVIPAFVLASDADVPVPIDATVSLISKRLAHNGSHYEIHSVSSEQSSAQLLQFYKDRWALNTDPETGYQEGEMPGWRYISTLDGSDHIVVQLKSNLSTSDGYISRMSLEESYSISSVKPLLSSENFKLGSSTSHKDINTTAYTQVYETALTQQQAVSELKELFSDEGWSLVSQMPNSDGVVMFFGRGTDQIEIICADIGGGITGVVLNRVER